MKKPRDPLRFHSNQSIKRPATTACRVVRQLVQILDDGEYSYKAVCRAAGVNDQSIRMWKSGRRYGPTVVTLEAVLETIGYRLELVPNGPA